MVLTLFLSSFEVSSAVVPSESSVRSCRPSPSQMCGVRSATPTPWT